MFSLIVVKNYFPKTTMAKQNLQNALIHAIPRDDQNFIKYLKLYLLHLNNGFHYQSELLKCQVN